MSCFMNKSRSNVQFHIGQGQMSSFIQESQGQMSSFIQESQGQMSSFMQ